MQVQKMEARLGATSGRFAGARSVAGEEDAHEPQRPKKNLMTSTRLSIVVEMRRVEPSGEDQDDIGSFHGC